MSMISALSQKERICKKEWKYGRKIGRMKGDKEKRRIWNGWDN